MTQNHHRVLAQSPNDLCVRGKYLEIRIGKIVLDATVRPDTCGEELTQVILFEVVYSNLWDYRITTYSPEPRLIDSDGFQHSACVIGDAIVHKSKHLAEDTELPCIANEIEGNARSHGWVAFPRLKKSAVPHRLIFQTHVFDAGDTCGSVRHTETLELVFDLSLFGRLLGQGKILKRSS